MSRILKLAADAATESLVLSVTDPLAVREVIRASRSLDHPDYNIALHHTLETTKILRNMGLEVPAPIRFQYDWPGRFTPFSHQIDMAEFLTIHRRAFNLSEMGTAKTNASLWAADWLMETGRLEKVLVLSPLSTLERVWATDIFTTLPHRSSVILHGSRERRLEYLDLDADFYILNHDGISIAEIRETLLRKPEIGLVIVDEAGMFRNHQTNKYKALRKLVERHELRLWLMTGTPCPNAPTDAWALARLVDPSRVPKYFGQFKNETMTKVSNFKWVPRHDAYRKAYDAMQPAIRFLKKDCLDLPPVTSQDRQCKISAEQQKAFDKLKAHMITEAGDAQLVAANAADQIGKLRQILCGVVRDTATGEYIELDFRPRLKVLTESIDSASAKVIVICPFKGIIGALQRELTNSGYSAAVINGDVSPKERDQIILEFKTQADPHILLCHPKVMAHGLNLTEADTLIFYAPIYSNDEFQQVTERFNRAGQTRHMTIIRMAAHPLEWQIYKIVDNKASAQNSILDLYQTVTGEPV